MVKNRAKRRFRSQRIGREGELLFETWATGNHLIANKQSEDFGIDYVCQETDPVGTGSEEVTGRTVHVQVRASSGGSRARVVLSREDVETALRQEAPYCLVGVHMKTKTIHFRFLDLGLLGVWTKFLEGKNESISHRLDTMETERARFIKELRRVSRPAFRATFAHAKAANALSAAVPGSRLKINSGIGGDWAFVAAPSLRHIFDVKDAHEHEQLARTVFSLSPIEQTFQRAATKFKFKTALTRLGDLTDGPILIAAPVEQEVTLVVEGANGKATAEAKLRHVGDERAYLLECGLVIRVSDARLGDDGNHYHKFSFDLVHENAVPLGSTRDLPFLKELQPGAMLNEEGRPGIDVQAFGLERIGSAARAMQEVYNALKLPLTEAKLGDLGDGAFATNIGFLEAVLLNRPKAFPIPAFVLGLEPNEPVKEDRWFACAYRVPIALRLKNRSIVVWFTGEGEAYALNQTINGFRFGVPADIEAKEADFEVPGDGLAAAYVVAEWPAIPLSSKYGDFEFTSKAKLPVEGEFIFDVDQGAART